MNNDLSSSALPYNVKCFCFNGCLINTKHLCDLVLKKYLTVTLLRLKKRTIDHHWFIYHRDLRKKNIQAAKIIGCLRKHHLSLVLVIRKYFFPVSVKESIWIFFILSVEEGSLGVMQWFWVTGCRLHLFSEMQILVTVAKL